MLVKGGGTKCIGAFNTPFPSHPAGRGCRTVGRRGGLAVAPDQGLGGPGGSLLHPHRAEGPCPGALEGAASFLGSRPPLLRCLGRRGASSCLSSSSAGSRQPRTSPGSQRFVTPRPPRSKTPGVHQNKTSVCPLHRTTPAFPSLSRTDSLPATVHLSFKTTHVHRPASPPAPPVHRPAAVGPPFPLGPLHRPPRSPFWPPTLPAWSVLWRLHSLCCTPSEFCSC